MLSVDPAQGVVVFRKQEVKMEDGNQDPSLENKLDRAQGRPSVHCGPGGDDDDDGELVLCENHLLF